MTETCTDSPLDPHTDPREFRMMCRLGTWNKPTPGVCPGRVQANLVILPQAWAENFRTFCELNQQACPLLEVTEVGNPEPTRTAPGADLRTDLPGYRVWKDGKLVEELKDITHLWTEDMVGFLIGCSFTFENALIAAQIPVRHVELGCNVPMYRTNKPCVPFGPFAGPLVVSMRPMTQHQAETAIEICSRFPNAHGAPVHVGDPSVLGIAQLEKPDYGDPVPLYPHEVPVFWACGVTPQAILMQAKLPFAITHQPGYMFITDLHDTDLELSVPSDVVFE